MITNSIRKFKEREKAFSTLIFISPWRLTMAFTAITCLFFSCSDKAAGPNAEKGNFPFYELENGTPFLVPSSCEGLTLFYLDPARDCVGCMTNLTRVKELASSYPNICFAIVLRGSQDRETLFAYLAENPISSYVLGEIDDGIRLLDRYEMVDEPALIFYNRNHQLISLLRKTEVDHLIETPEYFHQVLQQM